MNSTERSQKAHVGNLSTPFSLLGTDGLAGLHFCLLLFPNVIEYKQLCCQFSKDVLISCHMAVQGDGQGVTKMNEAWVHLQSNPVGTGGVRKSQEEKKQC